MSALYRLRQFWQGLFAHVAPDELQVVQSYLSSAAFALFCRLPPDAQRHSLNVFYDLQSGHSLHPDLAVAALLHDVGKLAADDAGVAIRFWLRGPLILLRAFAPTLIRRLQSTKPNSGFRYALYVNEIHPQIGAEWARKAGCSELACWLIQEHQLHRVSGSDEKSELLSRLQWADNRN